MASMSCGPSRLMVKTVTWGLQIICIDVLPLQFFPCHFLAPTWSDERAHFIRAQWGIGHGRRRYQYSPTLKSWDCLATDPLREL
jgi:hypothetical protein